MCAALFWLTETPLLSKMLSYMLPVEEKTSPRNLNLNLNLNGNGGMSSTNGNASESDTSQSTATSTKKLIHFEQRASALKPNTVLTNGGSNNYESRAYSSNMHQPFNSLDNFNAATTTTNSILTTSSSAGTDGDSKKVKMTKIGNTKNVTLKR